MTGPIHPDLCVECGAERFPPYAVCHECMNDELLHAGEARAAGAAVVEAVESFQQAVQAVVASLAAQRAQAEQPCQIIDFAELRRIRACHS